VTRSRRADVDVCRASAISSGSKFGRAQESAIASMRVLRANAIGDVVSSLGVRDGSAGRGECS
jgi:hypothetical protein